MLTFPVELLYKVLEILDHKSLLLCRQVCRDFLDFIDSSSSLQYTINLAISGQEDGPTSVLSVSQRLQILKQYQSAWDNLKWTSDACVKLLNGDLWELYGGILAQSTPNRTLVFRQLPSQIRSIEERVWSIAPSTFGFRIRDFALDPSQDLLVLIEARRSGHNADHTHRFHLRTLSTGAPHPLAPQGSCFCHVQGTNNSQISYTIQISGEHICASYNENDSNELLIWQWKTSQLELNIASGEVQSFAFLSEEHVLLAALRWSDEIDEVVPCLVVVNFLEQSKERCTINDLDHAIMLEYPSFQDGAEPLGIQIRSDPSPTWVPNSNLQVPFFTAPSHRIFVVSIWFHIEGTIHRVVNFIPWSSLRTCINTCEPSGMKRISWEKWGRAGSRLLYSDQHHPHSVVWVCYVFGSKYATIEFERTGGSVRYMASVYDFNQLSLRYNLHTEGTQESVQQEQEASSSNLNVNNDIQTKYVVEPTVFPSGEFFQDEIRSSLPYCVRHFPLQHLSPEPRNTSLMCSEDSLIIVDKNRNRNQFRILTF